MTAPYRGVNLPTYRCHGKTNRRKGGAKKGAPCLQPATVFKAGKGWCYYHNPDAPKKFGGLPA